jgi:hypothetical protein
MHRKRYVSKMTGCRLDDHSSIIGKNVIFIITTMRRVDQGFFYLIHTTVPISRIRKLKHEAAHSFQSNAKENKNDLIRSL